MSSSISFACQTFFFYSNGFKEWATNYPNSFDELQTQSLVTTNQISAIDNGALFMLAIIVLAPIIISTQEQIPSDWRTN